MRHCIDSYGNIVTSSYGRIKVLVNGSGKEVILILGRKTSPSSIIEMKPLVHFLDDKYTVVTLDYPGSGSSDNYHSMRTLDNITRELHEVMELLGYTEYAIVCLSYAGLYSLYYLNKYADEVKAVVGIDSFVAEQNKDETHEENLRFLNDILTEFHDLSFAQLIIEKAAVWYLNCTKSYSYTQDEIEIYSNNAAYMYKNMTLLDEYKCPNENFETLDNKSYPSHIPVLFILSTSRSRRIKGWYDLHKKLSENPGSKIITLNGGKNLHLKQPERLAEEIKAFLL